MPLKTAITLREARIKRVLGAEVASKDVNDIFKRLGLDIKQTKTGWVVIPPHFRFDIQIEEDLIEEIARIHGYNNLELVQPKTSMTMMPVPESKLVMRRIKQTLVDLGYQEAVTYSFVEAGLQKLLDPESQAIPLANPISAEMGVMRTNLWAGLVQVMQYNLHRQQNRLFLFECGLKFIQQATDLNQEMVVAGLLLGDIQPEQWGVTRRAVDFYDAKGHLESLFSLTGCLESFKFSPEHHPALHPGQSARIYRDDQPIGWLGALHPQVAKSLELDQTMYLFEIITDTLQQGRLPVYEPVSKYPTIRRDLAIVVDQSVTAQNVQDCVKNVATETLKKIELFDMYMGEGIDSGRKSLALGLTFHDLSRTLTDEEVEEVRQQIVEKLQSDLGATLRQ